MKDEKYLDRFDQVFGHVFKGLELLQVEQMKDIPAEWLKRLTDQFLTEEEKKQIEEMGGFDKLMEMLQEQMRRAQEGEGDEEGDESRRGNGRNFPIGANGYHPEGIRIGQDKGRHGKAIKVWDKREYKNLDDQVELGTRNIKVALRRLRKFARDGPPDELDMKGTIKETANKGYLDLVMQPERRNTIKVLLFFDIGGSMDSHIKVCEELFSAAQDRVQDHGVLLLPQLPLRERVEGQPPPPRREDRDLGRAEQLRQGLQGDLRRRRHHEPLRDHLSGRLGGALERGARRDLDGPRRPASGTRSPG